MARRHGCAVVPGDMMMDWVTPAGGGAAAQSQQAVRGAGRARRWRGLTVRWRELAAVAPSWRRASPVPTTLFTSQPCDRGGRGGLGDDGERVVAEVGQHVHGLADDASGL